MHRRNLRSAGHVRAGLMLVLAAAILVSLFALAAFAIDVGFMSYIKSQAQNCADASAYAAAAELYPSPVPQTAIKLPISLPIYRPYIPSQNTAPVETAARQLAGVNRMGLVSQPTLLASDIQYSVWENGLIVGPPSTIRLADSLLDALDLRTTDNTFINTVNVTVRRDTQANGSLPLFFAPALGVRNKPLKASATAAVMRGYSVQAGDMVLPFAMDITIWNAIRFTNGEVNALDLRPLGVNLDTITLGNLAGTNPLLQLVNSTSPYDLMGNPIEVLDNYTWRRGMRTVTAGPDQVWEVVMLADQLQMVRLPGLLGNVLATAKRVPATLVTLDFRGNALNAPDAGYTSQVVTRGLSAQDVQNTTTTNDNRVWLPFQAQGYFELSSQCEDELKSIIGQPRILPLYATLPGTVVNKVTDILGMRHQFQIVGWGAVVITRVNLSGPIRYINFEPAIYSRYTVGAATGTNHWRAMSTLSDGVYTSPRLIK